MRRHYSAMSECAVLIDVLLLIACGVLTISISGGMDGPVTGETQCLDEVSSRRKTAQC